VCSSDLDTSGMGARVYIPVWNSGTTTSAVAWGLPNAFGLYDVAGNGWKWCNDWFTLDYYASSPSTNPKGPATGNSRALRGGAWVGSQFVLEDYYKSATRGNQNPGQPSEYLGFTCARTK
jgi:sulfatase modifying factor 1